MSAILASVHSYKTRIPSLHEHCFSLLNVSALTNDPYRAYCPMLLFLFPLFLQHVLRSTLHSMQILLAFVEKQANLAHQIFSKQKCRDVIGRFGNCILFKSLLTFPPAKTQLCKYYWNPTIMFSTLSLTVLAKVVPELKS